MNDLSTTTSLALRAAQVARRFERVCRRRHADCRVEPSVSAEGTGFELRVLPWGGGSAESVSVSGLDGDSWADARGMESLAQVVSVWVEAPAVESERAGLVRRQAETTWLQRWVSPVSKPSLKMSPS